MENDNCYFNLEAECTQSPTQTHMMKGLWGEGTGTAGLQVVFRNITNQVLIVTPHPPPTELSSYGFVLDSGCFPPLNWSSNYHSPLSRFWVPAIYSTPHQIHSLLVMCIVSHTDGTIIRIVPSLPSTVNCLLPYHACNFWDESQKRSLLFHAVLVLCCNVLYVPVSLSL